MLLHFFDVAVHVINIAQLQLVHFPLLLADVFLDVLQLEGIQACRLLQIHGIHPAKVRGCPFQRPFGDPQILRQRLAGVFIAVDPPAALTFGTVRSHTQLPVGNKQRSHIEIPGGVDGYRHTGAIDGSRFPIRQAGVNRIGQFLHLFADLILGRRQLGVIPAQKPGQGAFVIAAVHHIHPVGVKASHGNIVLCQYHDGIQKPDVIKGIVAMVTGQDVKNQVAHLVEIHIPVVESAVFQLLMDFPGLLDIVLLNRRCAFGHADHFTGQGDIRLDICRDDLAQGVFCPDLGQIGAIFVVCVLIVAVVADLVADHGALTKPGHQPHQRFGGGAFIGLTFGLGNGLPVFPVRHFLPALRRRILHPVKGVLLMDALFVAKDDEPPLCVTLHRSCQLRHGLHQIPAVHIPAAECDGFVICKRLQKSLILFYTVQMLLLGDHNSEHVIHLRYPGALLPRSFTLHHACSWLRISSMIAS